MNGVGVRPALAVGSQGVPELITSKHAIAHFEDTAPMPISANGTIAAPALSAWQTDLLLLRVKLNAKPAPRPKVMTVTEINQMIAAALEEHDTIWREVIGQFAGAERKRWRDEIAKWKTEFELRIGALLGEVDKLQRGLGGDRDESSRCRSSWTAAMPHDPPLNSAAMDLLAWATVIELRDGADELANLCEPAKTFPVPRGRAGRRLILRLMWRFGPSGDDPGDCWNCWPNKFV